MYSFLIASSHFRDNWLFDERTYTTTTRHYYSSTLTYSYDDVCVLHVLCKCCTHIFASTTTLSFQERKNGQRYIITITEYRKLLAHPLPDKMRIYLA